jgi:hypothetical protein
LEVVVYKQHLPAFDVVGFGLYFHSRVGAGLPVVFDRNFRENPVGFPVLLYLGGEGKDGTPAKRLRRTLPFRTALHGKVLHWAAGRQYGACGGQGLQDGILAY